MFLPCCAVTAGTGFFRLARAGDSLYDSFGRKLRTGAAGAAGTYVGQEVFLPAKYYLGGCAHGNARLLYLQSAVKL